jgi:hypothetical protein
VGFAHLWGTTFVLTVVGIVLITIAVEALR